jgi:uncharacterized protein YfaS (alpha-2-macroglobulin family)
MKQNGLGLLILLAAIGLLLVSCGAPDVAERGVDLVDMLETATAVPPTPTLAPSQPTPTLTPTANPDQLPGRPPKVIRRTPNQRMLDELRPTIKLVFSQTMDRSSVESALFVQPALALNLSWQGNTLHIDPQQPFVPETQYAFVLADTAVNQEGVPLDGEFSFTYVARKLLGQTSWPTSENRSAPVLIHFNYAMDKATVNQALQFEPAIVGDLTWNDAGTVAKFEPARPLPTGTQYTISFGGGPLQDAAGNTFAAPEPIQFVTPPPVLDHKPRGSNIHPATQVRITFDRPMDETAAASAFSIDPALPGKIEWQETTLIFSPDEQYFEPNTSYKVVIGTDALSAEGEAIFSEPYSWNFQTGRLNDIVNFGWGPNAQVVDVNGRRAIQYQLFRTEETPVTFDLYQLSLEQFLDRYTSGFRGVAGREDDRPISTEGTPLVKSWVEDTTSSTVNYSNVQELIVPADVPPGLYILDMSVGYLNDQLILLVTENTVVVKQAEGQIVAWVTDINGGSKADAAVSVYARDGELIANGRTDANGIFETAVTRDPQPLIVVVQDGDDITASGLSNEWRSRSGQWWGWWGSSPAANDYAAYVYTDRPIYRPDQTVFFKAIVRKDDDAIISLLPAGTPVTVRIRDARNNVVQTQELFTNDFGTVNGQFQLAEGAMLGSYAVEILLDGESHRQEFKVEDYRKPDYQVTVTTDKAQYVVGEEIEVTVEAAYFMGEPVPDAQITINRFSLGQRYYWDESSNGDYIWYDVYDAEMRGRTDENGRFTFTLTADGGNLRSSWRSSLEMGIGAVEATVDDGSHQTVSGFAIVQTYSAAEKIRLDTNGYFFEPGDAIDIQAEVRTIADEPVNGRTLSLTLNRWTSGSSYENVVQTVQLTTGADGRASLPFTIEEPGYYQLRLSGRDATGKEMDYRTYVYAFSSRWSSWYGRSNDLAISADKDSYAPGESARLLIESPLSGPALLSFERGTTRREQLIELTAPVTVVEVPILPDDAPNIYVTVNVWQPQDTTLTEDTWNSKPDSKLLRASVNLSVPVTNKTLLVTVTPDKESYAPREEATFTVRVTNQAGTPVSAEVSLAMVDEAIFALSDDLSGAIFDGFYYERANIVRTFDSLALIRYLGGGGGGGGGDMVGNPRSDFPDTAEWFPILHTDYKGEAQVTVTLPDSLTSWRLTAKAVTADTQVGETFTNFTTKQDIVVRPILPRTLTAGDQVNLSAIVHNFSDVIQTIEVKLSIDNSQLTIVNSDNFQSIQLAPGEMGIVGWPVAAASAGEAKIVVRADVAGVAMDAVEMVLAVRPLAIPDVTTEIGQLAGGPAGSLATTINLPANALPMSNVQIELSRSIAGTLLEGLEYLTGFPYGCVEQTMSRALPNAVVGRALNQLGVSNPTLQADLPAKVNAGLQKLYGYQHSDGGWGWWYDDSTHDYQTAWVIFGLAVMADAGYEVDSGVIERGVDWLNENLESMDIRTQAYALYSMAVAGQPNREASLALMDELAELDTFSQAGLALALWEAGEVDAAQEIVDWLVETAVVSDEGKVYWISSDEDGYYYKKTMSSTTRSTALALSALVTIRPGHELEPGIVRWLMAQRQQNGWGTTNETSYAILALTDHLLATSFSESATATSYTVYLNDTPIATGNLGRGEPAVTIAIPADQMKNGQNALRITHDDSRNLYYVINNRTYLAQAAIEAAGVIAISREYLDVNTNQPLTTVMPGQLVKVRLTVNMPDRASYVIVEDSLPGGLEALNEGLNTSSHIAQVYEEPRNYWQEYGYNYKEIRSDRVSFFITEMQAGQRVLTYIARATHSGQFVAMPAEAYPMYDLATWGRSASSEMVVSE